MSHLDKRNPLAQAVRTALFAVAAVTVAIPAVYAEEAETAEAEEDNTRRITVTGSRIKRSEIETASPVHITSSEDIKASGFTRIEDMMNGLPQIQASNTAFDANGASGTASVDLRGLGSVRTLVLVNGRRLQPGNLNTSSPDINQIPAALVERVEVLTGGGSSTYGADAVAGVVNFIMKKDFEGVELVFGRSGYQHTNRNKYIQGLMDDKGYNYPIDNSGIDGIANNIDFTIGGTFDGGKGQATAYATWREVSELRQASRDYTSCALNPAGTECGGSLNTVIPSFFIGNINPETGAQGDNETWTLDPSGNGFIVQDDTRYNFAPVNHFQRPDTRYTMGAFLEYEISEKAIPYLEFMTMQDRTVAQIAESGTFFNEQYDISIDSDIISSLQRSQIMDAFGVRAGEDFSVYIGKRNTEGGPRSSNIETNSARLVFGSKGDINDIWSYDISYQFNRTSSSEGYLNDFFAPRIKVAVDAGTASCADTEGCIPYEVFTLNGVTEESARALTGVAIKTGLIRETIVGGYVTGEIGSLASSDEPVAVVLGAEYRREQYSVLTDEVFSKGLLLGQGGATPSVSGGYSVRDLFGEISIPIIQDAPNIESLTVDFGLRFSAYDRIDSELTYKAAIDYNPISGVKLRASYNRAVRSPNVVELFQPESQGLWGGTDPCAGIIADNEVPAQSAEQCANSGVSADQYGNIALSPASQYNGIFGGTEDLSPEIADTFTIGVVANPLDNFNFSIDYFSINIEEVIGAIGPQLIVDQCGTSGDATFCDLVTRGPSGSLWKGTAGSIESKNINLGSQQWEGIDFSANYQLDLTMGRLSVSYIGTNMRTKTTEPILGNAEATYDCVGKLTVQCFATPEWRHTVKASWSPADADWHVSGNWRFFGDVGYTLTLTDDEGNVTREGDGPDELANGGLGAQSFFDLNFAMDLTQNIGFLMGVNNVFDTEPPMVGNTLSSNGNTVAGFYDPLGRYFHASVTLTL